LLLHLFSRRCRDQTLLLTVFFYNIFLLLFRLGISITSLWDNKARLRKKGTKNIFDHILSEISTYNADIIWIHCASLGEFEQGRPVLERLKAEFPNSNFLITFFSPSGYEVRKDYEGAAWIFYLPMDSPPNAKEFLDIINPLLVVFIKYDYWYYYLTECKKRNIPLLMVSAVFRKTQPFFKWYGGLYRKMLSCFTHLFVQDEESKKLLTTIGIENCTVSGDTRFDRVVQIAENFEPIPVIERFIGNSKCIVAGSTWKEDEELLASVFYKINADLKLIIAPHEIAREHLDDLKKLFQSTRFSELTGNKEQLADRVLIIDNIGMLSRLYKYGDINYVGGGFTRDGIHNVLEAAVYGKPVIFGSNYKKYKEAIELVTSGGAKSITNKDELTQAVASLLTNEDEYRKRSEKAKQYVFSNTGATEKILHYVQENRLLTS
jgi:3-deoxy-D-manno-octulosonic-acid transferase